MSAEGKMLKGKKDSESHWQIAVHKKNRFNEKEKMQTIKENATRQKGHGKKMCTQQGNPWMNLIKILLNVKMLEG